MPFMLSKVLIVDDDEVNHEILNSMLGEHYDLSSAFSAQQGLDKLSQNEFDAILLDVVMPEMDGFSCRWR